jgi:hypothetical protein
MYMNRPKRIKQIMPIPDGYGVWARVTEEDGKTEIVDLTKEGFCYLLALIAGDDCDDYVVPYEFDQFGLGELNEEAILVQKQFCSKCGKEMPAQWDEKRICPRVYRCDCTLSR